MQKIVFFSSCEQSTDAGLRCRFRAMHARKGKIDHENMVIHSTILLIDTMAEKGPKVFFAESLDFIKFFADLVKKGWNIN